MSKFKFEVKMLKKTFDIVNERAFGKKLETNEQKNTVWIAIGIDCQLSFKINGLGHKIVLIKTRTRGDAEAISQRINLTLAWLAGKAGKPYSVGDCWI